MSEKITTHKSRDITLVLGGASSGKSAWAEQYILRRAEKVGYIATAQAFDAEMKEKVYHKNHLYFEYERLLQPNVSYYIDNYSYRNVLLNISSKDILTFHVSRINPKKKISLENVALINNFLGGVDEDWFVTIHVCIENAANEAIEAAQNISKISKHEPVLLSKNLRKIAKAMKEVNTIFARMPERCDPYVYYHGVRPFIFGTKDNPDLKKGLICKNQFNNKPQFYRGETGAQSSIIPLLDGALGVKHTNDNLRHYLNEMRDYMPPEHRKIIESAESKSQVSQFINRTQKLKKEYNACLEQIKLFRSQHLEYAATYIHKQSQIKNPFGSGGSLIRGTGGTPFMKYLRKHRDETQKHKVK